MIEIKNITKTYGKKDNAFKVLDDVNFTIANGASVAILGRSGSGKSTLMHVMSSLDRPDSGEVIIDGKNILELKQKEVDKFRSRIRQSIAASPESGVNPLRRLKSLQGEKRRRSRSPYRIPKIKWQQSYT